ncbi:glycosidase crf1 [Penicillium fimorum]|uniref:Glycosidase crf1 n=1 Tax=Penicillium fimorum TaxID=1882269 RepID=A0A9W9Y7J7_9EURO|nr:glycosidase crf1 [Penicillium fimorum]
MKGHLLYAALAATIPYVSALKAPDCNAFQKTCSSNKEFTIHKQGDAPTIVTDYYIFYDANDEIDWEALSGSTDKLQTNYYGKGDNSEDYNRWTWEPVATPQEVFHKYTWIWANDMLSWAIDGTVVRTVNYADAKGGSRFPQTPMRIRIGIWAGDDPSKTDPRKLKGAIQWAGGETNYSEGPFTMYVKSVEIVNYTPAESYVYSDKSGSSDSIEIHGTVSSDEAAIPTRSGTSNTTDMAISTSSLTGLSSSISPSAFSSATTNSSSPTRTLPMTSSAKPEITVLASNSTSTAGSVIISSLIFNSSTRATASATSFNSASGLALGYLGLLTLLAGFIQVWT